jgi:uncharacterized paraquat-inducible protein A
MVLRKCPACKDTVGAESPECPRCGVNFREYRLKQLMLWTTTLLVIGLAVSHYAFKLI